MWGYSLVSPPGTSRRLTPFVRHVEDAYADLLRHTVRCLHRLVCGTPLGCLHRLWKFYGTPGGCLHRLFAAHREGAYTVLLRHPGKEITPSSAAHLGRCLHRLVAAHREGDYTVLRGTPVKMLTPSCAAHRESDYTVLLRHTGKVLTPSYAAHLD